MTASNYFIAWKSLGEKYSFGTYVGKWSRFQNCRIDLVDYKSSVSVLVEEKGVHLKTEPLFFIFFLRGHPELFIPWQEFESMEKTSVLFSDRIILVVRSPHVKITLPAKPFKSFEKQLSQLGEPDELSFPF